MNQQIHTLFIALLLTAQGCEKVRNVIVEKAGETRQETSGKSFDSPVVELAEADYEAFINQKGHLILVNFGADWCGPCRQLGPVLERVSAEFGDAVKLGKVDVDKARNVAMRNGVRGIPDVRFFRDGKQVHQFSGAQQEARIRETLKKLTEDIAPEEKQSESLIQKLNPLKQNEEKTKSEEEEKEPTIRPMEKDWLPPGIERR
jgi:thioredoxin